ncbi:hypothetical protein W305_01807 [Staphylococcus aureus DAR5872]|nr:hypothetical protein W348_02716 [Staphylococcus aureus DAR5825]EYR49027.1 hypothetical protein W305_01807 [Staphylococcus aureus DAR5872]EYR53590.1 hypothetical protein W306_01499 [Staphylococcus aureus DAR5871]CAC8481974.1 LysR family HTH-type transcriptional regulator [Staphylococcus aureus]CAC8502970.1 LysR family HTH-type transcriptional regulator [Staphylococcus aureus]
MEYNTYLYKIILYIDTLKTIYGADPLVPFEPKNRRHP